MEANDENIALVNTQAIDHLTEEFYRCISFNQEHFPNFDRLKELFYGSGNLINNNFEKPVEFTVQSFAQALMQQIEAGNTDFHSQQEIGDVTEFFGKIAQRISVYEHSNTKDASVKWKRGVNYIQYIFTDRWQITSMIWSDETEGVTVPQVYLL
ncbi:MAG TPA: hypothetical protein VGE26_00380 [Sphingobacteriaceae bacterium]